MQSSKKVADISIIIPTKNEEKYLPNLLKDLKAQSVQPKEIIIADANSTDNTIQIAKKFGAKIVKGGIPAVGRNNGAKAATCQNLLFLDADMRIFNSSFIKELSNKFNKCDVILFRLQYIPKSLKSKNILKFLSNLLINILIIYPQHIFYNLMLITKQFHMVTGIIATTKNLYSKSGGFPVVKLGEDRLFAKRVTQLSKNVCICKIPIFTSARRFTLRVSLTQVILMPVDFLLNIFLLPFPQEVRKKCFTFWQDKVVLKFYKPTGGKA